MGRMDVQTFLELFSVSVWDYDLGLLRFPPFFHVRREVCFARSFLSLLRLLRPLCRFFPCSPRMGGTRNLQSNGLKSA